MFREVLRPAGWIRAVGVAVVLVCLAAGVLAAALTWPVGVERALELGLSLGLGVLAGVVAWTARQTVEVRDGVLRLALAPVWRKQLPLDDLEVEAVPDVGGLDYGGLGVRYARGRTVLIARPGPCLGVRQRSTGRLFIVRTDHGDQLAAALGAARPHPAH